MAGKLNFKLRIVFWNIFSLRFGDLKNESHFLKKKTFAESQEANSAFENVRKKEDLQLLQMKTEVKVEVKEETIEDFDAQEQIGIDLITNQDFDYA